MASEAELESLTGGLPEANSALSAKSRSGSIGGSFRKGLNSLKKTGKKEDAKPAPEPEPEPQDDDDPLAADALGFFFFF